MLSSWKPWHRNHLRFLECSIFTERRNRIQSDRQIKICNDNHSSTQHSFNFPLPGRCVPVVNWNCRQFPWKRCSLTHVRCPATMPTFTFRHVSILICIIPREDLPSTVYMMSWPIPMWYFHVSPHSGRKDFLQPRDVRRLFKTLCNCSKVEIRHLINTVAVIVFSVFHLFVFFYLFGRRYRGVHEFVVDVFKHSLVCVLWSSRTEVWVFLQLGCLLFCKREETSRNFMCKKNTAWQFSI